MRFRGRPAGLYAGDAKRIIAGFSVSRPLYRYAPFLRCVKTASVFLWFLG